jgi:hypothetical protein
MSLGDPYCSLLELKDYLKIPANKTGDDTLLEDALASATQEINETCNRQFNKIDDDEDATERSYGRVNSRLAYVDDFYTTEDLVVTVADTVLTHLVDFDLKPLNGVVNGEPGWPFWKIKFYDTVVVPAGGFVGEAPVKVTAKWGWAAVPAPVKQACLIMASENFQMKDTPFGVAGMDMFGTPLRVRDNRIASGKILRYARGRIQVGWGG